MRAANRGGRASESGAMPRHGPLLRAALSVVLATLPACLFAPDRPRATADAGDDAGSDGSVSCMPSADALFPVAAVIPRPAGDMLVRGGREGGVIRISFYAPAMPFSPTCRTATAELPVVDGHDVIDVHAIAPMGPDQLLVLVTREPDAFAAIYQIDLRTFTVAPDVITSTARLDPIAGRRSPFIVHSEQAGQIWFGGPRISTAQATRSGVFAGTAGPSVVTARPNEDWYLAAATTDTTNPFAIVGLRSDYLARRNSSAIDIVDEAPRVFVCDTSLTSCPDRIAHAVPSSNPGLVVASSVTPTGTLTLTEVFSGDLVMRPVLLAIPPGSTVLDLAVVSNTPNRGVVTLDRLMGATADQGTRVVRLYANIDFAMSSATPTASEQLDAEPRRRQLVAGVFEPGGPRMALVLDDEPGSPLAREACFTVFADSLQACAAR
jgi:hypothetical protein